MADELRIGRTFADVTPTNVVTQVCSYPVCPGYRAIVHCLEFTNKNYDIYLPPGYSATNNPLPILYTFHPNSNGMVGNFGSVASDLQVIVVGVRESSNDIDWDFFIDSIYAITRDIRRRLNFDATAVFTSGWSGGGYEAYMHSQILRQEVSGVYAMCSWVPHYDTTYRYMTNLLVARANALQDNTGLNSDWAPDGTYLDQVGAVRYDTWFPGPHAIAPDTNKTDCLTWLLNHRAIPAADAQEQAKIQEAQWRANIAVGQGAQTLQDCFAAVFGSPRTFEANQAQLVIDDLQTNYTSYRVLNVTNLWPGDYVADYLYYRAFGAAKIGDTNTYFACLKTATWLTRTSGDRTSDFQYLLATYGFPKPQVSIQPTNNNTISLIYRKDSPWVNYLIEQSSNAAPGSWTASAVSETPNQDGTFSISLPADSTMRFFRLAATRQ